MMKKWNFRNVCLIMSCVLLCCGCGGRGTEILIGGVESPENGEVSGGEQGSEETPKSGDSGEAGGGTGGGGSSRTGEEVKVPEQETVIRVYVCGAVANPGVVEITQGSRVEDALKAAGGFAADAGREAVNLADWVSDGQKVYFPREGEAAEESAAQSQAASGLVNINTADMETLCTLPGIGESRARDIISYREANGGFEACEDIMKVPGIKTAAYEKIRDKITVK